MLAALLLARGADGNVARSSTLAFIVRHRRRAEPVHLGEGSNSTASRSATHRGTSQQLAVTGVYIGVTVLCTLGSWSYPLSSERRKLAPHATFQIWSAVGKTTFSISRGFGKGAIPEKNEPAPAVLRPNHAPA